MACRDLTKAEIAKSLIEKETECEKEKGSIIVEHLDLCSLQSVREFVARILASEATIQILINNAGVMMCPESKTKDGFETHIGSNHFAPALLTLLLLPRLIQDGPSRIVFVSSMLHESKLVYYLRVFMVKKIDGKKFTHLSISANRSRQ